DLSVPSRMRQTIYGAGEVKTPRFVIPLAALCEPVGFGVFLVRVWTDSGYVEIDADCLVDEAGSLDISMNRRPVHPCVGGSSAGQRPAEVVTGEVQSDRVCTGCLRGLCDGC